MPVTAGQENDLYKLKGIGPKHTEMLESIGVDSIKELSHRNPASLTKMIADRHGTSSACRRRRSAAGLRKPSRCKADLMSKQTPWVSRLGRPGSGDCHRDQEH